MVFDITKLNSICDRKQVILNVEKNKIKVSRPELPLQSYWLLITMIILLANFLYRHFFCTFCETCNNILSLEKCMICR